MTEKTMDLEYQDKIKSAEAYQKRLDEQAREQEFEKNPEFKGESD